MLMCVVYYNNVYKYTKHVYLTTPNFRLHCNYIEDCGASVL